MQVETLKKCLRKDDMDTQDFLLRLVSKATKRRFLPLSLLKIMKERKQERIFNAIREYFSNYLLMQHDYLNNKKNSFPKIIWILWYQGLDKAPEIVKACINSVMRNNLDYKIVVLTDENVWDYYNAPNYIKEKFLSGVITKTHFSDILRFYLLRTYGGVWLDATVYMTKSIPACFSVHQFATLKDDGSNVDLLSISKGRWAGYIMSSIKGGVLANCMYSFFEKYWECENSLIDYFLIDYALLYCYSSFDVIRNEIELGAIDGSNRFYLIKKINKPYSNQIQDVINADNLGMYKLNYKDSFISMDKFGNETVYSYTVNGRILHYTRNSK